MSVTRSKFLTPPTCNKSSILLLYITPKIFLITKEEDHQWTFWTWYQGFSMFCEMKRSGAYQLIINTG